MFLWVFLWAFLLGCGVSELWRVLRVFRIFQEVWVFECDGGQRKGLSEVLSWGELFLGYILRGYF